MGPFTKHRSWVDTEVLLGIFPKLFLMMK